MISVAITASSLCPYNVAVVSAGSIQGWDRRGHPDFPATLLQARRRIDLAVCGCGKGLLGASDAERRDLRVYRSIYRAVGRQIGRYELGCGDLTTNASACTLTLILAPAGKAKSEAIEVQLTSLLSHTPRLGLMLCARLRMPSFP